MYISSEDIASKLEQQLGAATYFTVIVLKNLEIKYISSSMKAFQNAHALYYKKTMFLLSYVVCAVCNDNVRAYVCCLISNICV